MPFFKKEEMALYERLKMNIELNPKEKPKRIAIFSDNLKVGGIQKSLVNVLKSNAFDGYIVDVFLYDNEVFFDVSCIKENVTIHYLKPMPYWTKAIPFGILKLFTTVDKRVLKYQYDVAIDFDSYQNATALGTLNANAKKRVMWVHNDMEQKRKEEPKYNVLWNIMRGKYKYFDEFVAVSEGIVDPFVRCTLADKSQMRVIPNIIDSAEIHSKCEEKSPIEVNEEKLNIVSVGRLCHQKGFDILLNDISKVYKYRKDIKLYILGDGPDKSELEQQAKSLGIKNIVHFLGNIANPFPIIKQMDVFCLESRYEGQGMVFWEAKALGLQLIFPKHLEKYNPQLIGADDVVQELLTVQKKEKNLDVLAEYNNAIIEGWASLIK